MNNFCAKKNLQQINPILNLVMVSLLIQLIYLIKGVLWSDKSELMGKKYIVVKEISYNNKHNMADS